MAVYLRLWSRETIWLRNTDRVSHRSGGRALFQAMLSASPVRPRLVALLHFVLPNDVDASLPLSAPSNQSNEMEISIKFGFGFSVAWNARNTNRFAFVSLRNGRIRSVAE